MLATQRSEAGGGGGVLFPFEEGRQKPKGCTLFSVDDADSSTCLAVALHGLVPADHGEQPRGLVPQLKPLQLSNRVVLIPLRGSAPARPSARPGKRCCSSVGGCSGPLGGLHLPVTGPGGAAVVDHDGQRLERGQRGVLGQGGGDCLLKGESRDGSARALRQGRVKATEWISMLKRAYPHDTSDTSK